MTRRQLLISQMRKVLNDLQSPTFFEYNEDMDFEIDDVGFNYSEEYLEEEVSW